ncbi:hypothetical protein ACP4OV_020355 [Aristida adscensionis]
MAAAAMRMVKAVLVVVLLVQILNVLAADAARPFKGEGWLEDGIGMVVDILGDLKQGSNPPSHCCN